MQTQIGRTIPIGKTILTKGQENKNLAPGERFLLVCAVVAGAVYLGFAIHVIIQTLKWRMGWK